MFMVGLVNKLFDYLFLIFVQLDTNVDESDPYLNALYDLSL